MKLSDMSSGPQGTRSGFRLSAGCLCLVVAGYTTGLELVVKDGDPATGTNGEFKLPFNVNNFHPVAIDNCGRTYFFAASAETDVFSTPLEGIWAGNGTATVDIAIDGQSLPQFKPAVEECVGIDSSCGEIFNTQAAFHVTGHGNVMLRTSRNDNIGPVAFLEGASHADLTPILTTTDVQNFPFSSPALETDAGDYLAGPYAGNEPFGVVDGGMTDFVSPLVGGPAPDVADPVTVTSVFPTFFTNAGSTYGFNQNTDLLFAARLSDNSEALYLDSAGTTPPVLLARTGDATPGISFGAYSGILFSSVASAQVNNSGKGYYFAVWVNPSEPFNNLNPPRDTIWRFDPAGQSELVVSGHGNPVTDYSYSTSEFTDTVFDNISRPKIAPNGDVWFYARGRLAVNGFPDHSDERVGLWRSPAGGGDLELVLRSTTSDSPGSLLPNGPDVPGTPLPGGDFYEAIGFFFYGFDEHSHLAFSTSDGLYMDRGAGLDLVIHKDQEIELAPGDTRTVESFLFNSRGWVGGTAPGFRNDRLAFSVQFTDGSRAVFRTSEVTSCELPYVVNSKADGIDQTKGDGLCNTGKLIGGNAECTLRAAIEEANARAGKQTVLFDIPADQAAAGIYEIRVNGSLPSINDPMVIDATSQKGYQPGSPVVELNGIRWGDNPIWGFQVFSGETEIKGFSLYNFSKNAILLQGMGENLVSSNIIGTNAQDNPDIGIGEDGILILNSANNTIGGTAAAERNLISRSGQAGTGGYGLKIEGMGSTGNKITGNYIGTNVAGTKSLGNGQGGILLADAPGNFIGGSGPGAGNLISGNTGHGVRILDPQARNNVISGNIIGLNEATVQPLPNTRNGVLISNGAGAANVVGGLVAVPGEGAGNIISGNLLDGIRLRATGQFVLGNIIGTNALGTILGNRGNGVSIDSDNNEIGNGNPNGTNVISGNLESGILVSAPGKNNLIDANLIGTDVAGVAGKPNDAGITIRQSSSNKLNRNLISGNNLHGILITDHDSNGNQIEGNYIGTDRNGINALGNEGDGILLQGALNTLIRSNVIADNGTAGIMGRGVSIIGNDEGGGADPKQSNANNQVIANHIGADVLGNPLGNVFDGVLVSNSGGNIIGPDNLIRSNGATGIGISKQAFGVGNLVSENSILGNVGLGIDLGVDGVTLNDQADVDNGANGLQNFPVINTIIGDPLNLVQGYIKSKPNTAYTIELFSNTNADASSYGEGEFFEGAFPVVTNGIGDAGFTGGFGAAQAGDCISVTARENDTNDTSEFSLCEIVGDPVLDSLDYGDAPDADGLYPTLAINNGARHRILGGLYLGSGVDPDIDGQPNMDATGDDNAGVDDEQGVTFIEPININSPQPQVEVMASTNGKLDAWIDFNGDGDWNDDADQIFSSAPLVAGLNSLGFIVPPDTDPGLTFARFRFSTEGSLTPIGPALDGEVEDHQVEITPLPQQLDFLDEELSGTRSFEVCTTITLEQVGIYSGANITLIAPNVELLGGFSVEEGAILRVIIATPTQCI